VSGTLVYRERIALSSSAVAEIAIVQQIGPNKTVTLVGRQSINSPGDVPIAFNVQLDQSVLDTTADAQLWALITDGDNAWTTPAGVAVATNGAPSQGIVVPLTYRPDLMEGEVTGTVTGAGPNLSADAVSITWLLNGSTLAIVGFDDTRITDGGAAPIPFAIPFSVANLDQGQEYVIQAFVYDGDQTWTSSQGVPVITNGNPLSDIVVTVNQITPFATATPAPSVAPTPSPAPTTPPASGGGIDPIWILLIGAAIGGAVIGGIYLMRRQ
jgi:uncharacterized lipoprotein YbaY